MKPEHEKPDDTQDMAGRTVDGMLGPNPFVGLRGDDIGSALIDVWTGVFKAPQVLMRQQQELWQELMKPAVADDGAAAAKDKRFSHPDWQDNPAYAGLLKAYLAWSQSFVKLADAVQLEDGRGDRARFVLQLIADALSPTNTLIGNPAALRKLIESKGTSLADGFKNFLSDLAENEGMPSQIDKSAFDVGRNLAITPGSVIFRNDVLELIQYLPTTDKVHARPHLFVPPQINRFYVFDLAPGKSLVEHLVGAGFQVFLVSWRNPSEANRDWDLGTYVKALIEAIEVVTELTESPDLILHAACSGAMTAVVLASLLAARKEKLIHAMTLMVAVLGNSEDSQLSMFATPDAIEAAKRDVAKKGVLEGQQMGRVFAWMRPNDLVWNYWVNNYLLGNAPPTFDILYWNNDTTRLPAKFHGALLDILSGRLLLKPNAVAIDDTKIDVGKITADTFVVAGLTDHITPWREVFDMARGIGGASEFVLSSSGHIQSLINPPGNPRAKFRVGGAPEGTADEWLKTAETIEGSWWDRWVEWLATRSGALVAKPGQLGSDACPVLDPAPGRYVHE